MDKISSYIVPAIIIIILVYGYIKKVPLYETFIEGAKEGLKSAVNIAPYLVAILVMTSAMRSSGFMDFLLGLFTRPLTAISVPDGIVPLLLIRPFSGSASLGMLQAIFNHFGPDSYEGYLASVMAGSTETVFYTTALYFGSISIKKTRYAITVAVSAWLIGTALSLWVSMVFINV